MFGMHFQFIYYFLILNEFLFNNKVAKNSPVPPMGLTEALATYSSMASQLPLTRAAFRG